MSIRRDMKTLAIAILLCFWINILLQQSLEQQALILVQRTPASDLDPALPNVSLPTWFNQIVGPRAGVIWQLSECGEAIKVPSNEGPDMPACLEANATLSDGNKVVIEMSVENFIKGNTGRNSLYLHV